MWKEIFCFEIKYHLKQPIFYVAAIIFFTTGVLLMSTNAGIVFSDVPSTLNRDAPLVIVKVLTFLSLLGLFVITAFVSSSALRDFDRGTHMLFFTKPVSKFDYLMGRFAGSMVISLTLLLVTTVSLVVGRYAPWQEAQRIGPFALSPYVYGLLVMVLPNLLMLGAVFFAVASWSRRLLVAYICVVAFLGLQDVAESIAHNFENDLVASLIEPMGIVALKTAARYWTISEYSSMLPSVTGGLLHNRLLWIGVGLLALAWSYVRFSYSRATDKRIAKKYARQAAGAVAASHGRVTILRSAQRFSPGSRLLQLLHHTKTETAAVVRTTPFIILIIMGLMIVVTIAFVLGEERGTPTYPVTRQMLQSVVLGMSLFLTITIIFYSGELVWRERALRLDEVNDALPTPDWVYMGSKLLTLCIVAAIFILAGVLSTVVIQVYRGFFHFELSLYFAGFLIVILYFVLFSVLALFMQVVTGNRFTGYLLTIVVFLVSTIGLNRLGLEHNLYRYPGPPEVAYSDMNGYGHLLVPFLWLKLYWGLFAVILLVTAALFWRRGVEIPLKGRLAAARERFRGPLRTITVIAVAGFVATGSFIFYNTNVLNEYRPKRHLEALQAEYEKKYSHYSGIAQPRITGVYAEVDIFPSARRVEIRGRYRLQNKTDEPLDSLHLTIPLDVKINALDPGEHTEVLADTRLGYHIHALTEPVAPGQSIELSFDLTVENHGFVNNTPNLHVISNGTFFSNHHYFPSLGYDSGAELIDRNKRRKHRLPPAPRMAVVNDPLARRNTYISSDADWIDFETIVSTSAGQIAIAPGYLQRQWEAGGRRYFHYKMDAPILNFYAYLSADYAVKRDMWRDVVIEVFYHPPHSHNIDRMIEAVKRSLDYFTANYSPYQHRQVRILEFPCYEAFAQSFPNTIPFSEAAGFIYRIDDNEDIDYVFCRTAHEVAHQWWAHQVIGANVQGATLMSEALAEYSALMVMEKEYGPDKIRHLLKYELDGYLRGRGRELIEEMPLALVENQMYIHYNKGCMVMYALKDYIGEANVNRALAGYIEKAAFEEPPYTNSIEFLSYLREVTPDSLTCLIEDMFETITIFSNRVKSAGYTAMDDGRYVVNLEVEARKFRADGKGVETEIAIGDWIDIGIFGEDRMGFRNRQNVLFMEKRHITESRMSLEVVVDELPVRAGIDPYNRLIDRDSDDNVRKVTENATTSW